MTLVICDMSVSLDGYVTGPNDSRDNPFGDGAGTLHDWFGDAATGEDRAILQDAIDTTLRPGPIRPCSRRPGPDRRRHLTVRHARQGDALRRTRSHITPAATHLEFQVVG